MDVFNICPLSFIIDLESDNLEKKLKEFISIFTSFNSKKKTTKFKEVFKNFEKILNLNSTLNSSSVIKKIKKKENFMKIKYPLFIRDSMKDGKNMWLLKPISLNRGRGIKIFDDLSILSNYLYNFYFSGCEEEFSKKSLDNNPNNFENSMKNLTFKKKSMKKFIVQKYIEKPMLINNRKFDIRIWVLITQDLKYYYFKYNSLL